MPQVCSVASEVNGKQKHQEGMVNLVEDQKKNLFKSTKSQGDWGLGEAIAFFAKRGHTIAIPLTDSQPYDLVVFMDGGFKRIQVKTTTFKVRYYVVNTATTGRRNKHGLETFRFDYTKIDYFFIVTQDEDRYLIPSSESIPKRTIKLSPKYDKFKV